MSEACQPRRVRRRRSAARCASAILPYTSTPAHRHPLRLRSRARRAVSDERERARALEARLDTWRRTERRARGGAAFFRDQARLGGLPRTPVFLAWTGRLTAGRRELPTLEGTRMPAHALNADSRASFRRVTCRADEDLTSAVTSSSNSLDKRRGATSDQARQAALRVSGQINAEGGRPAAGPRLL